MAPRPWRVPRDWAGETVFVVAGGPSVLDVDLELLRGRRTIAINEAWLRMPWADVLFYADRDWWTKHGADTADFAGEIVTTGVEKPPARGGGDVGTGPARAHGLYRARKIDGRVRLSEEPDAVAVGYSSVIGASNLAYLRGAAEIVWLGVDNGPDAAGRVYHHDKPRPAAPVPRQAGQLTVWQRQAIDMRSVAADLAARGVRLFSASPLGCERLPFLTYRPLAECLA